MKNVYVRSGNIPQIAIIVMIYIGYVAPVLLKHFLDINGGGVEAFALNGSGALLLYVAIWLLAFIPFYIGFGAPSRVFSVAPPSNINGALWTFFLAIAPVFLLTKILLAKEGVYQSYAFDSGAMVGGVWSFSMFLSEALVLMFTASLLAGNKKLSIACFVLISVNLLHGTRIFNFVSVIVFAVWYLTGQRFTKAVVLKLILAAVSLMLFALVVFLYRSNVDFLSASLDQQLFYIFSPVVYESVFSQTALLDLANSVFTESTCNGADFLIDFVGFITPRVINEGKDAVCLSRYAYLQPLGAFNGVFAAYIYFGWLYPIYFLVFGFFLRCLRSIGPGRYYFLVIYFYCLGNISVRIIRDGPILAGKYLTNALILVLLIFILEKVVSFLIYGLARARLNYMHIP